ncbi:MAG: hypothetical protein IPP65_00480 [Chlorobi bacterium]|nr:hypothetical protein [Chlorobiota bacterium]
MKKFIKSIFNIFVLTFLYSLISCSNSLEYDTLGSNYKNILDSTEHLKNSTKKLIEGVYSVTKGNIQIGDNVVIKIDEKYLSVFSGKNEAFMITLGGVDKDTNFSFEGYWRYAQTEQRGKVNFSIAKNDGALSILNGLKPNKIIIKGRIDGNNLVPTSDIELTYLRPLYISKDNFYIVGHRGGGRNSDLHPFSENSIQMINFASALGANGVEIDIRLTKDKVPVLYHDENINQRLTKSPLLVGPISNYTYDQLLKFGQLVRGEEIPTLEQVLKFIVSKQSINFVWLDVKIPEEVDTVIALQKRFQDSANKIGRKLVILLGCQMKTFTSLILIINLEVHYLILFVNLTLIR